MNEWKTARKKPVEIQFREVQGNGEQVNTHEGILFALPDRDFIIKGVNGELYPIKKDIFAKTYDLGSAYPEEFTVFYNAMLAKMQKKRAENGDTWKDETYQELYYRYSSEPPAVLSKMPMEKYLKERLKEEIAEWKKSGDVKELVDIANFCAMLYCRKICLADKKTSTEAKE